VGAIKRGGMIKKVLLNLSQAVQNHRFGLWILLILLTATILLFPIHLHYEYHAIESIYVFGDNLPLFGILYYIWLAILLLLLFTKGRSSEWQRVALVCTFALVFFGFWVINTPTGGHLDELWNMGHIKYLLETGKISLNHPNFGYFQFPAFHLVNFSLSQISGLGIFETRILFLVFSGVLFAALLYLLFMRLLKNPYLTSLAVLLIVQGSIEASKELEAFWPGNLAILLFVVLLMLLSWREDRALGMEAPGALIMIILLAAFTMSYLPLPAYFIFILAGIYLLQKVAKKNVVRSSATALFLVLFLTWEMYFSIHVFGSLAGLIPTFVAGFKQLGERAFSVGSGPGTTALGESVPLWASSIKFFWLALIFGLGTILGIWNLLRAKKLDSMEVIENGGLLGVIVFSIVCFFTFPVGEGSYLRFFRYAPFFTIPIVLKFLSGFSRHNELSQGNIFLENSGRSSDSNGFRKSPANLGGWFGRHVITLLVILFFALSLPTFLIQHNVVCSKNIYLYDCSVGEFLESAYGAKELNLFSEFGAYIYTYYVTEAHFHIMMTPENTADKKDLLLKMNQLVDNFENLQSENAIFILSEKFRQPRHSPATIEPTDSEWVEFVNRLARNNKIYDNCYIQIYERISK
jgi:hypothetical protein